MNHKSAAVNINLTYKTLILGIVMSLFIFPVSGCGKSQAKQAETGKENIVKASSTASADVKYETIIPKRQTMEKKLVIQGSFRYNRVHNLTFGYEGGIIKDIYIKNDRDVKKGDLLAEIYDDDLKNEYERQKITLQKAKDSYQQIKLDGIKNIEAARIQLEKLEKDFEWMKAFPDSVSAETLKDTEDQLIDQKADYADLKAAYGTGNNGSEGYGLRQAASDIENAQDKLDELTEALGRCKLVAPIDGRVIDVAELRPGAKVGGNEVIVELADTSKLMLTYNQGDSYKLEFGMNVDVTSGRDPDNVYHGKVVMINPAPVDIYSLDQRTIGIQLDSLPEGVRNGDTATFSVVEHKSEDALVLPAAVVGNADGRRFVYVLENGVKKEKSVQIGIADQNQIEIVEGINDSDKIIVNQ